MRKEKAMQIGNRLARSGKVTAGLSRCEIPFSVVFSY